MTALNSLNRTRDGSEARPEAWLSGAQLRKLRARFLGLARHARRTDYPMFRPYLRIARTYRDELQNRKLESN